MIITELKTNDKNPRLIKDDKFKKLVESIREFPKMMELRPIIIDENNIILGGNMRFAALKELKYKEIPENWVKKANELTEEEKKQFIIKDNVGLGEWDWDVLANEWDEMDLIDWNVNIPIKLEDITKLTDDEFEKEIESIKNEDAKTPIVKEFCEDYNAFIIICKNEIDELYLRNLFGITETIANELGLDNRKTNVLTVEELKCAMILK